MSKKSAKSKGYRKSAEKKAYLSKKEIIVAAVVAVIVIAGLLTMNILGKPDGLKVRNGVVQVSGENSLIVNTGTGYNPLYEKLGQLKEIEGWNMTAEPVGADENVLKYVYTPAGESPIDTITVRTYTLDAGAHAASASLNYLSDPNITTNGTQLTEDDGRTVRYLTFFNLPAESEEAEEQPLEAATPEEQELLDLFGDVMNAANEPVLVQALHGYVDAGDERMIHILIRNDVENVEEYVHDSILVDAMNQVLSVLSYETR